MPFPETRDAAFFVARKAPATLQAGVAGCPEGLRDFCCDDFGLVVAAAPSSAPVKRDGHHEVHAREQLRGGETASQHAREELPGPEVSVVFQCLRDEAVLRVRAIMKKSRSTGIRLIFISGNPGVVPVGHGIVAERGEMGLGKVGEAVQADVPLLRQQRPSACHAYSRQHEVRKSRE